MKAVSKAKHKAKQSKKGDLTKEKVIFEQGHLEPLRKNVLMHYFASAAAPKYSREYTKSLFEHSHRPTGMYIGNSGQNKIGMFRK